MFEVELSTSIKNIFELKKVTFDSPGQSQEQECIFIEIDKALNQIKDGRAFSKVTGRIRVFAQNDKLSFGYFSKQIAKAEKSLTKPFFFHDFEESSLGFRNLVERSVSFVYFFNTQFDPDLGTITSVNISEVT